MKLVDLTEEGVLRIFPGTRQGRALADLVINALFSWSASDPETKRRLADIGEMVRGERKPEERAVNWVSRRSEDG